jgi:hypothetical protein
LAAGSVEPAAGFDAEFILALAQKNGWRFAPNSA